MKTISTKSFLLLIVIFSLLSACGIGPKFPPDDVVKKDWDTFVQNTPSSSCVSFTKFEIVNKEKVKDEYRLKLRISGDWNCAVDTINVAGPFDLFTKEKGKNQAPEINIVYVNQEGQWILKGFFKSNS